MRTSGTVLPGPGLVHRTGYRVPLTDVGYWEVPSSSTDVMRHVRRHADGTWSCDCPDFFYRQRDCKHIVMKRNELRSG